MSPSPPLKGESLSFMSSSLILKDTLARAVNASTRVSDKEPTLRPTPH